MKLLVLQTERLILREMQQKDKEHFIKFMTNQSCTRYLMFSEEQKTPQGAQRLFDFILNSYQTQEPLLVLTIALKETDEMIGSTGASLLEPSGIYECYYSLLSEMEGYGYATEATRELFRFLFQKQNAIELRAYMHPENNASQRVAKRLSMEYKGIRQHPVFHNDGILYVCFPDNSAL